MRMRVRMVSGDGMVLYGWEGGCGKEEGTRGRRRGREKVAGDTTAEREK